MRVFIILLFSLVVASCVPTFQLKKTDQATTMWNSYSVTTSENINELKSENSVFWTQDGPILERIEFWEPVSDGETLPLAYMSGNEAQADRFRADMTPEEVVELLRNGFSLMPLTPTFFGNLQPMPFGDKPGYLMDVDLSAKDGSDFKGNILFTTHQDRLMVIYFTARETHYYETRRPYFDAVVQSITLG
jgi:hypothetical protein|tara:strand:- start:76 stop:645 length:570 start_codon:yes stop_codon:yes gene_type:complete